MISIEVEYSSWIEVNMPDSVSNEYKQLYEKILNKYYGKWT